MALLSIAQNSKFRAEFVKSSLGLAEQEDKDGKPKIAAAIRIITGIFSDQAMGFHTKELAHNLNYQLKDFHLSNDEKDIVKTTIRSAANQTANALGYRPLKGQG